MSIPRPAKRCWKARMVSTAVWRPVGRQERALEPAGARNASRSSLSINTLALRPVGGVRLQTALINPPSHGSRADVQ